MCDEIILHIFRIRIQINDLQLDSFPTTKESLYTVGVIPHSSKATLCVFSIFTSIGVDSLKVSSDVILKKNFTSFFSFHSFFLCFNVSHFV